MRHEHSQLGVYADCSKEMSSIILSALHSMSSFMFLSGFALHACSNHMQRDHSTMAMLNKRSLVSPKSQDKFCKSIEALTIASLGVMCQWCHQMQQLQNDDIKPIGLVCNQIFCSVIDQKGQSYLQIDVHALYQMVDCQSRIAQAKQGHCIAFLYVPADIIARHLAMLNLHSQHDL